MQPLHAGVAHPERRPAFFTRQEIDRGADAKRRGDFQSIAMRVDPQLLLGRAHPDDEQIGAGLRNLLQDSLILLRIVLKAQGRTVRADDFDRRPSGHNFLGGPRCDSRCRTQ